MPYLQRATITTAIAAAASFRHHSAATTASYYFYLYGQSDVARWMMTTTIMVSKVIHGFHINRDRLPYLSLNMNLPLLTAAASTGFYCHC